MTTLIAPNPSCCAATNSRHLCPQCRQLFNERYGINGDANDLPEGDDEPDFDAAKASAKARRASEAAFASETADAHRTAAAAHDEAANLHDDADDETDDAGEKASHQFAATGHRKVADDHRKAAAKMKGGRKANMVANSFDDDDVLPPSEPLCPRNVWQTLTDNRDDSDSDVLPRFGLQELLLNERRAAQSANQTRPESHPMEVDDDDDLLIHPRCI